MNSFLRRMVAGIGLHAHEADSAGASRVAIALATGALLLAACATVPPPPVTTVASPPLASVIVVQPVRPEPAPVFVQPPPEPAAKVNEEAEEALAILNDLQKLVLASSDEQKRELSIASQAMNRQRSDVARLRLGMLQSLPANGSDENRAIQTLEPLLKGAQTPVRAAAVVILAQLGERQRTLREEKRRAEDLAQKLEALRALERTLLGRERKSAP